MNEAKPIFKEGDVITTTNRIPLSEHLKTLGNREELVGLKVWDELTGKYGEVIGVVPFSSDYVTSRYNGRIKDNPISNLSIDLSEQEK